MEPFATLSTGECGGMVSPFSPYEDTMTRKLIALALFLAASTAHAQYPHHTHHPRQVPALWYQPQPQQPRVIVIQPPTPAPPAQVRKVLVPIWRLAPDPQIHTVVRQPGDMPLQLDAVTWFEGTRTMERRWRRVTKSQHQQ